MLSRKAAGAFVCLSCRLHRAGASRGGQFLAHLQPSSPSAPAALRRRYGTDATNVQERRGESSGSADWSKPRASETADPETLDPERDPDEARVEDFLKQDPLARRVFQPASDEKSQGGRAVSDEILNQAAQTIISRRGGSIDSRGNAAQESKSFGDPQLDLSATLEREGVDVTLADTLKNIHELQPLRSRVLSDVDYQALQLVLVRGFTLEQLRRYIHYSRAARDFEKGNLPPWILQRPLWKAMLSDAPAATQNGLDTTKKGKLADRLMGECWGLTTETSHDREGQLDIRLRDVEFTLLSLGNKRYLNEIARHFKSFPVRIELYPPTKILRVIASKVVAESILEEINGILGKTKTVSHDLDLISTEPLSPAILEQVGGITNSVVQLDADQKRVTMSWIHKVNHLEDSEDSGDVVLRFLLSAFGPKRRTSSLLVVQPKTAEENGRFVRDHEHAARLPWKDRPRQWSRWITERTAKEDKSALTKISPYVLQELLRFEKKCATVDSAFDSPADAGPVFEPLPGWSTQACSLTRAVFGHVLHAAGQATQSVQMRSGKFDSSLDRTFMPVPPPLASLQIDKYSQRDRPRHSTLLLRFLPDPNQDPALSHASPPLELRLEMDGDDIRQVLSIRAMIDTFNAHVLYPQRPVDVSITQQRYYELSGADMSLVPRYVAPVRKFLDHSTLQLESGTLRTPTQLSAVSLPRRLLRPREQGILAVPAGAAEPGALASGDAADHVSIDYRFSGLEIHRGLAADYGGYTLWYRQVQAGQHGGNWTELSLDEAAPADAYTPAVQDVKPRNYTATTFLQAATNLIQKQSSFAWQTSRAGLEARERR